MNKYYDTNLSQETLETYQGYSLQSADQALRFWEKAIFFEALETPLQSAYASIFESPDGAFETVRRKLENAKKNVLQNPSI